MNWSLGVYGAVAGHRARLMRTGICLLAIVASWWVLAGVAQAAPTPVTQPTIAGTAQQQQTLTLTQGTYTDTGAMTVSDQWESCLGASCTPVVPLDPTHYLVGSSDVGHTIQVVETAAAADGNTTATATTATVTALPLPANTALPTITGTAEQGQTLTLKVGTWTPTPTASSDQWQSCSGATCTAVGLLNSPTYQLASTDVGHTIRVLETAADASGTAPPVVSLTTGVVTGNASPPRITGIPQEGQVLTLIKGTWTNGPTSVTDQWQSCAGALCTAVGTLNGSSYLVAPTDVGHSIRVVETAAKLPALPLTATTAPVGPVSPLTPPVNVAAPAVSGTPQQGQTLTLAHGTWMNSPASITDQWQQCDVLGANCVALPGETGTTYTLTPGDVGHTIGVVETASNDGGSGLPAGSGHSGTVTATSATSVVAFSSNAPTTNQTVTIVATISSSSGNASPSGSVSFFAGSGAIGGCTGKPVRGGATVTVICPAGFAAGNPQIYAAYQPGPGSLVQGSTSAPTTIAIGRDSTSVSLAVTKQVHVGKRATYSAAVVLPVSNSGPIEPTGSIAFLDGGQPITACASQQLTNLTATCSLSYKRRGKHQISAVYSGDSNFNGSTSSAGSVQIVKGKTTAPPVLGFVRSLLAWSFFYHPTYTQVMQFKVSAIVNGTTVLLACQGNGCAFAKLQLAPQQRGSINLLSRFQHRKLKPGTHVTLRVTHANWVGKFFSFTIRAGAPPVVAQKCIAVGRTVPGVGC